MWTITTPLAPSSATYNFRENPYHRHVNIMRISWVIICTGSCLCCFIATYIINKRKRVGRTFKTNTNTIHIHKCCLVSSYFLDKIKVQICSLYKEESGQDKVIVFRYINHVYLGRQKREYSTMIRD